MASKIYTAANAPKHEPHQWRHVGSIAEPAKMESPPETAMVQADHREAEFQVQLKQQCEQAYRQGEAMGRKAALAEMDEKLKALGRAIESAASHKARLRQEAERDVVSLSLAVARRVLRRQLQVDEEAILGLVKAAFDNTSIREVTHVRVHPQFVSAIQRHLESAGAPVSIQLSGDASLELGGVILETGRGCLDASIDTQLDEIGRGFTDALSLARRNA